MSHGSGSRAGRAVERRTAPRFPRPAAIGSGGCVAHHTDGAGEMPTTSVEFRTIRQFACRPAYAAAGILACYAALFLVALEAVTP